MSFLFFTGLIQAQQEIPQVHYLRPDSSGLIPVDTGIYRVDTMIVPPDTLQLHDTAFTPANDVIDAPIKYNAKDSMVMDMVEKKAYLYGDAEVDYRDITLKADYIEIDFNKSEVFAHGLPDSVGKIQGKPEFTQGSETFESETIRYNFKSKKGYIRGVTTEQEGGFLHSAVTKRRENGAFDIKGAKYTTCDLPHPHYYVALTKAEVIPGKEIISGPAYMVIADVPLPIAVPFGFFPMKKTHASGILIPEYGEEKNRGFFLRNGGYYFALNDYFDLSVTGDIYTNGTWGVKLGSNYKRRYKYSGNFGLTYYKNVEGSLDVGNYLAKSDYSVRWTFSQDPKANPTSSFRASVNLSSSSYDRNHSYNAQDYLTNTKQSSISFSKRWPGSPFNFTGSFNQTQNSQTKDVSLNLPKLSFNMNRIYPFRGKRSTGKRWYENIDLTYNAMLENRIKTKDSLLFTPRVFDNMNNGFKQTVPLGVNFKPFNGFNITPRVSYTGILYTSNIEKHYEYVYDTVQNAYDSYLVTDTIRKIQYAQSLLPRVSFTLNPKIYGMYVFKNPDARVVAIRHVMTPTATFSYVPDMNAFMPNYYRTIVDTTTDRLYQYSIYERNIYGTPSLPGKSAVVNLSLTNNVEMKVRTDNDSTGSNTRKIKLLENLSFSTNYNIFKDSLRWAPLSFNGRTSLWKNNIQLTFGGLLDPYALDENGRVINQPNIKLGHSLFRATRLNLALNLHFKGGKSKSSASGGGERNMGSPGNMMGLEQQGGPLAGAASPTPEEEYDYFNIPWDVRIRYNINYSKPAFHASIVQTLNLSGSFSLTPKWKISGNTGWDFKLNKLTYTSLNIHRDLHCWEMSLSWIPIGYHQSYSFVINIKSSILRDLKYQKRKGWYDR